MHQQQPRADQGEPRPDQPPGLNLPGQPPGDARSEEHRTRQREDPQAGLDRAVAEDVLQVDHHVGEQRED
jgi:hypothetical protein